MYNKPRHSRYDCHKNPPPGLTAVLGVIGRAGGHGRFNSKHLLRNLFKRGHREYDDRGPADDLLRFLLNTGCVIECDGRYYFDAERAAYIEGCCVRKTAPGPNPPAIDRLKALIARGEPSAGRGDPRSDGSSTTHVDEYDLLTEEELEALTAPPPPSAPVPRSVPEAESTPPPDETVLPPEAPIEESDKEPIPASVQADVPANEFPAAARFLMHLTAAEAAVWSACKGVIVSIDGEEYADLPAGDDPPEQAPWSDIFRLHGEAFYAALAKFVDNDVFVPVSKARNGIRRHAVRCGSSAYASALIPSRRRLHVQREIAGIIGDVERGMAEISDPGSDARMLIERWLAREHRGIDAEAVAEWLCSAWDSRPDGNPENPGWGILLPDRGTILRCIPGFEAFEFIEQEPAQEAPKPFVPKTALDAATQPLPAPPPAPSRRRLVAVPNRPPSPTRGVIYTPDGLKYESDAKLMMLKQSLENSIRESRSRLEQVEAEIGRRRIAAELGSE